MASVWSFQKGTTLKQDALTKRLQIVKNNVNKTWTDTNTQVKIYIFN